MAHSLTLNDRFMNYLPFFRQSQGKLCIAHIRAALRDTLWLRRLSPPQVELTTQAPPSFRPAKAASSGSRSRADFPGRKAGNAELSEACPRGGDGIVEIDPAARVFDDHDGEVFAPRILGRITHAKIEGETREKNAAQAAFAQDRQGRSVVARP